MSGPVLFFDGCCNLCNRTVRFIIRHDAKGRIHFAPLQSAAGKAALKVVSGLAGAAPDSLIFLEDGHYYIESDAALHAERYLDGGWKAFAALRVFPKVLRDAVYRFVARNRYRWLGRKDSCMVPTPDVMERFIA